jgi:hypothetical protein
VPTKRAKTRRQRKVVVGVLQGMLVAVKKSVFIGALK